MDVNGSIKGILDAVMEAKTPVNAVASEGVLTIDVQVTATDTMTVGGKLYTFVADDTAELVDGDIKVGSDEADGKVDIVAAINGTDSANTANEYITAGDFAGDDAKLTAKVKGIAGDTIATVSDFTSHTSAFDGLVLGAETAGVNGTQGKQGMTYQDASYWYLCIAKNTIADANWRRFAVGSVY